MKIYILLLLIGLSTQLYGSENTLYEEVIYNKPDVGIAAEVYLGDRMLTQQVGEWKECIIPQKTFTKKIRFSAATFTHKKGEPLCKSKLSDKNYNPNYANGIQGYTAPVCWKERGKKSSLCVHTGGVCQACIKNISDADVKHGETFIYNENSFQQTIEYAGKSGEILKFTYSEFSEGFARQAFARDFQVDLSEGNVAAYKGAIIEILEATNMQIKYKVIRNFSSDL